MNDLTWVANEDYDLTADLTGLNLRVLNLWGEDDPVRPVASPAVIAALPNSDIETIVLSNCGHFWHECPDEFFTTMGTFLGLDQVEK